jgi:pimeloyl-ACP methyl ester carboxylesterase
MPTVESNGISIYYEIHGESNAGTVILINGIGQWHAAWWRNIDTIAAKFRVVSFDNRGIGDSDKPDIPYSLDMLAEDTLGLMDALNIEKAHLVGHSQGGGIALFVARKAPERVERMVLASTLYWGPKVTMPSARAMQALSDRSGDPLELVKRGTRIATSDDFEAQDPEGFQRIIDLRFQSQQPPHLYLRQSQAGLPYFNNDYIADFTPPHPVMLLVGEHDEVAQPANSEAIAAVWPESELFIMKDAGHMLNIQRPDEFNRVIVAFLSGQEVT